MNAPDRAADVRAICAGHPEAFGPPDDTNDSRRLSLLVHWLIPTLNLSDGRWGVLRKRDQNGKVPCDVLVWRDTREHFDVLTGTGATWIPHGILTNPAWVWEAVPGFPDDPPQSPPAPPEPPPPVVDPMPILAALSRLDARMAALESRVAAVAAKTPPPYTGRLGPLPIKLTPDLPH